MADDSKKKAVEQHARPLRQSLAGCRDVVEKRMFGGLSFIVAGHMCCGVTSRDYVFRIGQDRYQQALTMPNVRPCDFTGRPMSGMVMLAADAVDAVDGVSVCLGWALDYVTSLPPKS